MKRFVACVLLVLPLVAVAQVKSVAILGDSYSTFEGYVTPSSNESWYMRQANLERTDVTDVSQTWWYILCKDNGYRLAINNSYSGATISFAGYRGEDYSQRSFLTRADNLGQPDIILVFGGTNDSWAGSPLGEMKYADWETQDFYSYRPALCYLASYLTNRYFSTDIYFLLNCDLKEEIGESMEEVCSHYGIPLIKLHDIDKKASHPTQAGMKAIAEQVAAVLRSK